MSADTKNPSLPLKKLSNPPTEESTEAVQKEIPIAARAKGPGPAAYTLPPTIGHAANSKGKRAPAYSFGIKLKVISDNQAVTPGPNSFFPQTTRNGLSKGPAFSLKGSYKKKEGTKGGKVDIWDTFGLDTPGPGKYYPKYYPTKEAKAPAYSIAPRRNIETANDNPGPASYEINPTLGMHPIVTVPAPAAYSIKPLRPLKLEHMSPGPAAYEYNPAKVKRSAPKYSLSSRIKGQDALAPPTLGPTPGPGQYTPKLKFVRGHIPQFSFRCKHSEYELFVPDSVNEEFSF